MKSIPPISIKTLIIAISLLITAVISVCLFLLQSRFNDEISSSFEEETIELMKSLDSSFYFSVSVSDAKGVDAIATSVVNNKYIYSIEVRNNTGEILSSKINGNLKDIEEIHVIPYEIAITDLRHVSLSPFDDNYQPEEIGKIKILLTRHRTNRMLSSVMKDNLIVLFGCILIVIILIAFLGRILTANFVRTSKALRSIGTEEFKAVQERSFIDDFTRLNAGLNEIGGNVSRVLKDLRESDDFKRNIITMISHDLRTPVNTIAPLIEIMLEIMEIEDPESIVKEHLEICRDSTKLLKSIMDQLIDFKEVNNSNFVVNTTKFDPERLFDTVYNLFKSKISPTIKFSVFAEKNDIGNESPFSIIADENKILRILTNIIENSVKFTLSGSINVSWRITCEDGKHTLEFSVCDTGSGIEETSLPRIFDHYYRANDSVPGWGVGLSVVKQFIDILSGDILVTSERSLGTQISVRIPVSIIKENKDAPEVSYECSVLVVDDNENNCYVMKNVLENIGLDCTSFTNPIEAISEATAKPFDIIIVDYSMPEMSGVEFAKLVREKGINVPVICTTAHIESEILSEINSSIDDDSGITHLLMKPIDISVIQHTIGSIIHARTLVSSTIQGLSKR